MPSSPERERSTHHRPPPSNLNNPTQTTPSKRRRRASLPDIWFAANANHLKMDPHHNQQHQVEALRQAVLKMKLQSLSNSTTPPSEPDSDTTTVADDCSLPAAPDYTSLLSDELLLKILSRVPDRHQHLSNALVCRRWSRLSGKMITSLTLLDFDFLESGRLIYRFPELLEIDIVKACVKSSRNSGIWMSNRFLSLHLNSSMALSSAGFFSRLDLLNTEVIDRGLKVLAGGCQGLKRVILINVGEEGLGCLSEECETLQELELHCVNDDMALKGISKCRNLQILKLVGRIQGFYDSAVSDIGLTILAQGCRRLVKLELVGCEGSYDGIKAIGQCCQMLEELTLADHRMDGGWLSALSYCSNLKTLKLQSCKSVDVSPGLDEHLGSCPTLEELHLQRCQLRDKQAVRALFVVCETVRELVFEDCWGLDNSVFSAAVICRNVRFLSLEGCSLLTTEGLQFVVLSWKDLKRLRVDSCKNIKDSEITPELATLFSILKELKWRPDSKSLLSSGLAGTGVGQSGRSIRWK